MSVVQLVDVRYHDFARPAEGPLSKPATSSVVDLLPVRYVMRGPRLRVESALVDGSGREVGRQV